MTDRSIYMSIDGFLKFFPNFFITDESDKRILKKLINVDVAHYQVQYHWDYQ